MGKDHTIYAVRPGWVRFYYPTASSAPEGSVEAQRLAAAKPASPLLQRSNSKAINNSAITPIMPAVRGHPSASRRERRYIGVALTQDGILPTARGVPAARRFDKIDISRDLRDQDQIDQSSSEAAAEPSVASFVDQQGALDLGSVAQSPSSASNAAGDSKSATA